MVEKIDRVVIAVKDIEKGMKFFSDLLDIEFDVIDDDEEIGMRGTYSPSGLELLQPTNPDTIIGRFLEKRGEGLWAIVLKVKNMDEAVERFKQKGLKVAGDIKVGDMREVAFHPKGSFGVELILVEYPEMHPATIAFLGRLPLDRRGKNIKE